MKRQRLCPGILAAERDLHRVALGLIPAAANLRGHRETGRVPNRLNDAADQAHVLEAAGAAVVPDDLLDRTPKIDVHEVRLEQLGDHRGRRSHDA